MSIVKYICIFAPTIYIPKVMKAVSTVKALREELAACRDKKIGFVPTMGALHEGHATLLRQARELAGADGCVVASVFLNPVQFDNAGDLASYPKTPAQDLETCDMCGVDVVFMPSDPAAIPEALKIAKKTLAVAWQNVIFALVIKFAVMVLGLFGFASMWLAVFADSGVAMLCVLNSIRMLYKK